MFQFAEFSVIGRGVIKFSHAQQLMQSESLMANKQLESALRFSSCILTVAHLKNSEDIPIVVEFMKETKARNKALLIIAPLLTSLMLSNMTINFEVRVLQEGNVNRKIQEIMH